MPARRPILAVAAFAALIAACGGGSGGGKTPSAPAAPSAQATRAISPTPAAGTTAAPGTPAPTTAGSGLNTLLQAPCGLLTDAEIAPIGKPAGPGVVVGKPGANKAVTPVVVTREGIATSRCRWDMPDSSYLEAELYMLSGYSRPHDYAQTSLAHWADVGKATAQPVAGIGDFAGVVVPSQHNTQTVAIFFAQKGDVAISVYFSGPDGAPWPTAAQLQQLGTAAAARIF